MVYNIYVFTIINWKEWSHMLSISIVFEMYNLTVHCSRTGFEVDI